MFRIKNNGLISKTCYMSIEIRQGCPISAILYLFEANILAFKSKNKTKQTNKQNEKHNDTFFFLF